MHLQKYSFNSSVVCGQLISLLLAALLWTPIYVYSQNVGIGTTSPTATLHVNGSFRLSNGSEGAGKVLTSDATGKANWAAMPVSGPTGDENVNGYGDWLGCEAENITAYQPIVGNQLFTFFGYQTAMNEQFAFVTSPLYDTMGAIDAGIVFVYELVGNAWVERQRLIDPTPENYNQFGNAVACDDSTLLVGSPYDNVNGNPAAGSVCVFTYNGSTWEFSKELEMSTPSTGSIFGSALDIKDDYLVIGAQDYATVGRAFVYFKNGSEWQYLMDIPNPIGTAGDKFGCSVAISDTIIAIGASGYSVDSLHCGSVFTYIKISGSFYFSQQIIPNYSHFYRHSNDNFGSVIDLDGNHLVACAPYFKRQDRVIGAVGYYTFNGTQFDFNSAIYNDTDASPGSFEYVSLSGPYCFVNAPKNKVPGKQQTGRVYLFKMDEYGGTKIAEIIDPTGEVNTTNRMFSINHVTRRFVIGNASIYTNRGKVMFGKIKI